MVKHTQTIRRQQRTNCWNVFDHLMGLGYKGLTLVTFSETYSEPCQIQMTNYFQSN